MLNSNKDDQYYKALKLSGKSSSHLITTQDNQDLYTLSLQCHERGTYTPISVLHHVVGK